ncbi:MAG: peptidylprolyl isomerase [Neomegalonema sp.]
MKLDTLFGRAGVVATVLFASVVAHAPAALAQTSTETPAEAQAAALTEYDAGTVVATVGDRQSTLGELIAARGALPAQLQSQLPDNVIFEGLLAQLIDEEVLANAAEAAGTADDSAVAQRLAAARRTILAEAYMASIVEPQLTEEALQTRYDEQVASNPQGEEVRARHILVATEDEAKDVIARLEDGATFEDLAREVSTGPSGANGGDLGFFRQGQMVPAFEEAAFALEAGGVSAPVQTQFGWHVIKLEERRELAPPAFNQVQNELRDELARELAQAQLETLKETIAVASPDALPPASSIREDELLQTTQ